MTSLSHLYKTIRQQLDQYAQDIVIYKIKNKQGLWILLVVPGEGKGSSHTLDDMTASCLRSSDVTSTIKQRYVHANHCLHRHYNAAIYVDEHNH